MQNDSLYFVYLNVKLNHIKKLLTTMKSIFLLLLYACLKPAVKYKLVILKKNEFF